MNVMESVGAFLQSLQGVPAYALVFGALAGSGFGLPVNEDLLLVLAAALTLRGVMEPVPLVAVAWCGIVIADALVFHWGHRFGGPLLQHRLAARLLPPDRLSRAQARMVRWGPAYLFAVRFMPGMRSALLFAAGSLKMPYRHLFLFDGAAALVEVPLLVYAVRHLGGRWEGIVDLLQAWRWPLLAALAAMALAAWGVVRIRAARRSRT
jgi:membrane protein DedA with SNARE-associated domain